MLVSLNPDFGKCSVLQNYEKEVEHLDEKYAHLEDRLCLLISNGIPAGCGALMQQLLGPDFAQPFKAECGIGRRCGWQRNAPDTALWKNEFPIDSGSKGTICKHFPYFCFPD